MPRSAAVIAPIAVVAALCARAPAARAGSATDAVRSANDTMSRLLRAKVTPGSPAEKKRAEQVVDRLRSFLDIDELGRAALADHWGSLTDAQKKEYLQLLRALIEANYVKGLRARLDYRVVYTGESAKGDRVVVSTEVRTKRKGRPVSIGIDYVLRREGAGESSWRAVDVVTDGVGLVENYRAQFNRIIQKEGFDGLLARMRKKLAAERK
ncbi:MAG: ABC transporter substrate-binding protein [Deltaproteobacteria bacterium]|nr:MAG: ABC transporter substrate-binding protein [Deltaproteobacteria bacterium]